MWGTFSIILSVPHNIVMNMNNVMHMLVTYFHMNNIHITPYNWVEVIVTPQISSQWYIVYFQNLHKHYSTMWVGSGWGMTTRTLVPWRQGCSHPTRNRCMGWVFSPRQFHGFGICQLYLCSPPLNQMNIIYLLFIHSCWSLVIWLELCSWHYSHGTLLNPILIIENNIKTTLSLENTNTIHNNHTIQTSVLQLFVLASIYFYF